MINVYIGSNSIEVEGHANFAAFGSDIVCAGVSALIGGLYIALQEEEIEHTYIEGNGYVKFEITEDSDKAAEYLKFVVYGLHNIEVQFGEYITIHNTESFLSEP